MRGPQIVVGGVILNGGALLMVKRDREPNRGLWSVPGGRVEPGEYLSAALIREVREETGVDVEVGPLLGIFEVVGEHHYVILDFMGTVSGEGAQQPVPGDDAAEARWVPLDEVAQLDCTPRFVETLRGWGVEV